MAARLATRFEPLPDALRFYEFPDIADLAAFKSAYLGALDHAGSLIPDRRAIIEEAADAFVSNIRVAEEVDAYGRSGTST